MKRFYILFFFVLFSIYLGYSQDDDDCIIDAGVELTPGPTIDPFFTGLSTYTSETTVQMCYTVDEYNTPGTQNWMHGIIPLFGPGWDLSTLQPIGQPETQFWAGGEWIWVENITAGITGEFFNSAGWFFDAGSGGGTLDGDPTDNWGDGNNGPWTFCWEITTQSCPPQFNEASLIVEILNFADSETGSWNNPDALDQCIDDPSYYIQGVQLDCPTCDDSELTIFHPTCESIDETGGVVIVEPQGTGPWNYIWFNIDSGEIVEENFNMGEESFTVTGLDPGEYLIQVEDLGFDGGCSAGQTFFIFPPEEILVEFDVSDANCLDFNDGSIVISSIMNSNCIDSALIAPDTNSDGVVDNDDYSCPSTANEVCGCDFVTYFNSCQAENWYGLSDYDTGACSGFPNYEIIWTSDNSMESSDWDGELINLFPGDYTVFVTTEDNASPVFGCDFQTTLTVGSPDQFIYDITLNDVSCFVDENIDGVNDVTDASIVIELSGGTPPYTVFAGSETGLDLGVQIGSSVVFDNLGVGDYFFTPIDFFGCYVEGQEVFFSISEPEPLEIQGDIIISDYNGFSVSCNGGNDGFIEIEVFGGTGSYEFQWDNGSTEQNLINASAGTYSCIISDDNDCQLILDGLVLTEPTVVDVIATAIAPVSCSGASDGAIEIDVTDGVSPYSFSWVGPAGFSSNNPNIFNISTGDYNLTVIDQNDCEYQETFTVSTPNPIVINASINDISCFGFDDGSIDVSVSGGNAPYDFEWSNGEFSEDLANLSPGFYDLLVFDSEGCFETATYLIEEPSLLTATISIDDVTCFGDNTGIGISDIEGGTPPYTENWSGGADADNLFAGIYSVVITDDNGCVYTINDVVVTQPDSELQLDGVVTNVYPCNGGQNGAIIPQASGGTPPYEYSSPGISNFNALYAGTYTITVTDGNFCETDMSFFVDEPSAVVANINVNSVLCNGGDDGSVTAFPSGGTGDYTLTWTDSSDNLIDPNNLSAGTYLLSVSDELGCIYEEVFVVPEPPVLDADIMLDGEASCLDPFSVSVVGDLSGITGTWSGSGPGNIVFTSPSSRDTEVIVVEYGMYEIVFNTAPPCSEAIILPVSMISLSPSGMAIPAVAYCDFETSLQGSSPTSTGFWTFSEAPDNTNINIENPNSFNTEVFMTPINPDQECCYGDYLFEFHSCGKKDMVPFRIEKIAPDFGVSTFDDCILDASIFIENPISFTDALIDPGVWEWEAIGNNGFVTVDYATPDVINFRVSEYGLYEFRYLICDTFYQHRIGFSCPLELPNVLTPNGDLNNDVFLEKQLLPLIHSQINFTVYNRFGQIVHAQSNYDFQGTLWDGTTNTFENKELNDGAYYYILELFNNANQRKERYSGYVYLFRGDG